MSKSINNPEITEISALKNIREKQKLTIETVADGMKVSRDFILYIEDGKFDKLGAPTFLRGHITNYCKVIGVDPQEVLSLVPVQYLQHHDLQTADALGASPLAKVRRQSNHFGRYAVGTALLGMLTLSFYFIWDKWSLPKRSLSDTPVDLALESNDQGTDKKITYSSLLPQVTGPNLSNSTPDEDLINVDSLDDSADESAEDSPQEVEQESNEPEDSDLTVAAVEPTKNQAAIYSIKMQLEEQAWVSIKTLDGDKIVHDLIGPGLREYQSDKPLHFRIGNAKKLQLLINEDPVELNQLIKRDIADFEWPMNPS